MTELELEYTYLARELPAGLRDCPSKQIVDVYVPTSSVHPYLRIRQNGDTYAITKKQPAYGTDSSRLVEETIHLSQQEFEALAAADGKKVSKRRYEYNYKGHKAEIDVFEDGLEGLVLVDFEFADRAEQEAFTMPEFCLADLTQEEATAGGMLAGKTYQDIAEKLESYGYKPLHLSKGE